MHYQHITGDSRRLMSDLEEESIDRIITDPPYESMEKHRRIGTTTRLKKNWFEVITNEELTTFIHECYRVLKQNTHCFIMCDQETHYVVKDAAKQCGFKWHKFIVWDKQHFGGGYHFRAQHELICFLEKGYSRLQDLSIPDVISCKKVYNGYPTEKPVGLISDILKASHVKGGKLLDPFAGSCSISEAGMLAGMNCLSFDLNKECEKLADNRLDNLGTKSTLYQFRRQLSSYIKG